MHRSTLSSLCFRRFPCVLCLICFLGFAAASGAQTQAADAESISRELLYHPARRIELTPTEVLFRAERFTYRYDRAASQWQVVREKNFTAEEAERSVNSYSLPGASVRYRFTGEASEEQAVLKITRADASGSEEVVKELVLWTRQQVAEAWLPIVRRQKRGTTLSDLLKDTSLTEPGVAAITSDGPDLWMGILNYVGEGFTGLGTVIRFNTETNEARLYQPSELTNATIGSIRKTGNALWLGTYLQNEGFLEPAAGLVRLDVDTASVRSFRRASSPLVGSIINALEGEKDTLWVATDEGMCRIQLRDTLPEKWQCWRIVPTVKLSASLPVSDASGADPRGELPAGAYEVRWANVAFFEVVTPDAMEGWLETDDLRRYEREEFSIPPYYFENIHGGFSAMRLLEEPGGERTAGAPAYRVRLERVGAADAQGWQQVRARAGWIDRHGLEVAPVILAISSAQ